MKAATGAEMRRIDEATIQRYVAGAILMERAGQRVFEHIVSCFGPAEDLSVAIFAGRGNNAGDGLVVARLLAEAGGKVSICYMHRPEELSPDAAKNHARLENLRGGPNLSELFLYLGNWRAVAEEVLSRSDLIVDALLGTGISKPIKEKYAEVIEMLNSAEQPIVSIDIPSGVNADTGELMGTAIVADSTVTLGLPKVGCLFYPGKGCTGELIVGDIGIPREVIEEQKILLETIDRKEASAVFPRHDPTEHKFERGSLLVVAGSRRYAGAAVLTSRSALRTGCGIVYCAAPESIRTVVQSSSPEIVFVAMPETESGSLALSAFERLCETRFDALAIGPGLTTDRQTAQLVRRLVEWSPKPILIDADGINALAGQFEFLVAASRGRQIVVTPHSGELERLVGVKVPALPGDRVEKLRSLVQGTGLTLVHKGAPTVAAFPDGTVAVNTCGHPGMATAGSGDVLSGAISGFLAQGCSAARSARLGIYVHSRAAELAASVVGESGMIAGDCMETIPLAIEEIE